MTTATLTEPRALAAGDRVCRWLGDARYPASGKRVHGTVERHQGTLRVMEDAAIYSWRGRGRRKAHPLATDWVREDDAAGMARVRAHEEAHRAYLAAEAERNRQRQAEHDRKRREQEAADRAWVAEQVAAGLARGWLRPAPAALRPGVLLYHFAAHYGGRTTSRRLVVDVLAGPKYVAIDPDVAADEQHEETLATGWADLVDPDPELPRTCPAFGAGIPTKALGKALTGLNNARVAAVRLEVTDRDPIRVPRDPGNPADVEVRFRAAVLFRVQDQADGTWTDRARAFTVRAPHGTVPGTVPLPMPVVLKLCRACPEPELLLEADPAVPCRLAVRTAHARWRLVAYPFPLGDRRHGGGPASLPALADLPEDRVDHGDRAGVYRSVLKADA